MADEGDGTSKQYRIGYRKPPAHSRFEPGKSGNPKGRPKGSKNFGTVLDTELSSRITINEGGKRKKVTKRQAIAKQAVNKALSGDAKAISMILGEDRAREQTQAKVEAEGQSVPQFSQKDHMAMADLAERLKRWAQPTSSVATAVDKQIVIEEK